MGTLDRGMASLRDERGRLGMMNPRSRLLLLAMIATTSLHSSWAQDLSPRAYVITPLHSNAITLTYSFYDGNINLNGALPVSGATGTYSVPILSYYHAFSFFGRSANVVASLPYAFGNFQGTVLGAEHNLYRSGLLDSIYRVSVNLKGGPAMSPQKFVKWRQKMLLGVSLKVIGSDRSVRSDEADQLEQQPLVLQTGIWLFPTLEGQMDTRWLFWRLVLHHESRVLVAQPVLCRHQVAIAKPNWRV